MRVQEDRTDLGMGIDVDTSLQTLHQSSYGILPVCLFMSVFSFFFYQDANHIGLESILINCRLILMTSAKALIPNKVTFTGP